MIKYFRSSKMKKYLLAFALIVLFPGMVLSQVWTGEGRQVGYVYDEEGNPLEGVTVKLFHTQYNAGFEVKTDEKGKWVAMGIKGGNWHIDFEKSGYLPKKIEVYIEDYVTRRNKPIEITLEKAEGIVVTDDVKERFKTGNSLFEEENYEEAIKVYKEIIEEFPDAYIINYSIGNSYFQLEQYEEAQKYYQKVLDQEPDHVKTLMGMGNCYLNRDEVDKAMEYYEKIDIEKISDPTVLYNIGTIYYNNSRFEEALAYYKKAVERRENFLDARYQLGLAYLSLGKNQEALSEFESYLERDPDSQRADQVRGFIDYLKRK